MCGESGDRTAEARLDHAVEKDLERAAVSRHQAAARGQDELAAELERMAAHQKDETLRRRLGERAARARARAQSARERAHRIEQRLRDDTADPAS